MTEIFYKEDLHMVAHRLHDLASEIVNMVYFTKAIYMPTAVSAKCSAVLCPAFTMLCYM